MKYTIDFNKTINQLVPHYLGGRKLILYIQALVSPLQSLNDMFVRWTRETRIEAAMTSQVFKLEYYLNYKFRQYFGDPTQHISIKNSYSNGTPIYYSHETMNNIHMTLYGQQEILKTANMRYEYEDTINVVYSFVVYVPRPNPELIDIQLYESQIKLMVDKYKTVNKNYLIIYI